MPHDILFVTSPIFWNGGFPWDSLILSMILSGLITGILVRVRHMSHPKSRRQSSHQKIQKIQIPSIHDQDFVFRAINTMREIAVREFLPKHARAHTRKDIAQYCQDKKFLTYWDMLEYAHYHGDGLKPDQKQELSNFLLSRCP